MVRAHSAGLVRFVRGALSVAAASALVGPLSAQLPVVPVPPPPQPVDTVPPRGGLRLDLTALKAGKYVYQTVLERDASTTPLGTRMVSTVQANYVGTPSWLMFETRTGDGIPTTDSLFADSLGLRPLHWSSQLGQARLGIEFRGDSAFGATSAPPGRRTIVSPIPPGTIVNSAMLETELRLLPLQAGWRDSTTSLSILLGASALIPTQLSVIGEDRVQVPAGSFDCWVVSVRASAAHGLYWVSKSDPIVVRSAVDVPSLGGAELVSALMAIVQ